MQEAKKHRKSGFNFEELLNKEWSILTKAEYSELQAAFKKTDQRNGGITFYDLINIIRSTSSSIQTSESPFPTSARTKSTRTSPTRKYAYSISRSCSTPPPRLRRSARRTTEEKSQKRTNTVKLDIFSGRFRGFGGQPGQIRNG